MTARPTARSWMPPTRFACRPIARRISFGACGSTRRSTPRTTADLRTKGYGRSAIRSTCVRSSASEDWAAYQAVNARFAAAIDEELPTTDTPVFIQDYHLALVAARLRERRPAARTALFWHIPWPYPDRLRICPWRREILAGLLANDLLAFQLERDRRNFVLAVEDELDAEIEADGERIRCRRPRHHGHRGADRRGLRPHSGCRRRRGAWCPSSSGCDRRSVCRPAFSAWASIVSTTRKGFPSGSKRSTASSPGVPSFAAG